MKKRFWIIFMAACLVLTMLPFGVFAEDYPSDPVTLPIGGQAYAEDGWFRFSPRADGVYEFSTQDAQVRLSIYQTRLAPSEFSNAEKTIADGEQQVQQGRAAIEEAGSTYASGKAAYDEAVVRYEQKLAQHELARAEYERNLSLVHLPIIGEAAREIVTAFEEEEAELRWNAAQLEAGKKELENAEQMLNDGRRQLAEGEAQLQRMKDFLAASKAGESGEPMLITSIENDLLLRGLFLVHAGSEYLIHADTSGDPILSCKLVRRAFEDVMENEYYLNPVYWAAANQITLGTDDTHFSPEAPCSRSQVVTFLWRFFGCPKVCSSNPFADVSSDAYYYEAVRWAVSQGITNGTDDTHFSPDVTCTRSQVVTFLWRANGEKTFSTFHVFDDVPVNSYYFHAVNWALSQGITNGTDSNHFSPENTCTRAQVVTFLYRASR